LKLAFRAHFTDGNATSERPHCRQQDRRKCKFVVTRSASLNREYAAQGDCYPSWDRQKIICWVGHTQIMSRGGEQRHRFYLVIADRVCLVRPPLAAANAIA
jgi:transposase InsO family protein